VEGAEGLYDATSSIPWEEHLTTSSTFAVDASMRDTEHTNSMFVERKVKDAIVDRLREKLGARPDVDTKDPDLKIVVHLVRDQASISLDLSGEPLHRRGYRTVGTVAPLKETLAAAILAAAKYTGEEPLLDPMCGSGTLAIEAGLIACKRAPGLRRHFGVERWPHLKTEALARLKEIKAEAAAHERKGVAPILAVDRDPEVLEAARANVRAARLHNEITVHEGDATSTLPELPAPGLLVTNPPYGDRLTAGGQKGMKTFYFKLGERLHQLQGWRAAILSGNEAFESAFHARPTGKREMWNGPIECELLEYKF
jgi:23S rRNA (guanine2445-N2)-methyltransferase / 23S rRNA (guanine2069-N7)-methyltransferase